MFRVLQGAHAIRWTAGGTAGKNGVLLLAGVQGKNLQTQNIFAGSDDLAESMIGLQSAGQGGSPADSRP